MHALESLLSLTTCIDSFLDGYNISRDDKIVRVIALGVVLYRIDNTVVPYEIDISQERRINVIRMIKENLLYEVPSWEIISRNLLLETGGK